MESSRAARGARRVRPRAISALLALIVGGVLVACGDDTIEVARQPAVPTPVVAMGALVTGELQVESDGGCVWLNLEGRRHPVIWPVGTTAREDPFEVVLADGTVIAEGNFVLGGGGYLKLGDPLVVHAEGPDIEWACVGDTVEVAVFNQYSEIEVSRAP